MYTLLLVNFYDWSKFKLQKEAKVAGTRANIEEDTGTTPTISEYEQMRLSNIARNKRKLEEIFGKTHTDSTSNADVNPKRKKTEEH